MNRDDRLLSAAELGEILHVPVSWCWKAARTGQLPHVRLPGGRFFVRFDLSEVEKSLRGGDWKNEVA
jgi:predicted DNA-binding transcriptional regulator AlpA